MPISASNYVNVNPGVIGGGGNAIVLNGVFLTQNPLLAAGSLPSFVSQASVGSFFGTDSEEYAASVNYFLGYNNSTLKPGNLFFAPYHATDVAAFLRGGSLAGLTLTELQAISGSLIITIDGTTKTASALDFSAVTSFSQAATLIATDLSLAGGQTCVWDALQAAFVITSGTTGVLSTITACTGTASNALALSSTSAITLSQGADADTPTTAMDSVVTNSKNWASYVTIFEPDTATKLLFAEWNNSQSKKYTYIGWDSDITASTQNATATFGYQVKNADYEGVVAIGGDPAIVPDGMSLADIVSDTAFFLSGAIASVNFTQPNGRIDFMYKSQSGLLPTCGNDQTHSNLLGNGYNFYAQTQTSSGDIFGFYENGSVSGTSNFLDSYVNQIYWNSQFQQYGISLLTQVRSIPYNQSGFGLIYQGLQPVITGMGLFGAYRPGIQLSEAQIAIVNAEAGTDISNILFTQGYYLQILAPTSQVRTARGSPIINFWYTDGQSVQRLNINSTNIL